MPLCSKRKLQTYSVNKRTFSLREVGHNWGNGYQPRNRGPKNK